MLQKNFLFFEKDYFLIFNKLNNLFSFNISVGCYFFGLLNRGEVAIKLKEKSARIEAEKASKITYILFFRKVI
jgi:hypothetical protein